jgi:uncharacterized membrane protein
VSESQSAADDCVGAHRGEEKLPSWLQPHAGEHRWPVVLAIVGLVALQWLTPQKLAFEPRWLLPVLELALLALLVVVSPFRMKRESRVVRILSLALVALASLAVLWSTARLVVALAVGDLSDQPETVLLNGAVIWLTNVGVFALWYWELDRGGPASRANARRRYPDWVFPQMTRQQLAAPDWKPNFFDYLYMAFTNGTAFSPTHSLPLTHSAKATMMLQASVSYAVVILVVARAINILSKG